MQPEVLVRRAVGTSVAMGLMWVVQGLYLWGASSDLRGASSGLAEDAGGLLEKGGPGFGLLGLAVGASSGVMWFFVAVVLAFVVATVAAGAGLMAAGICLGRRQAWARWAVIVIAWIALAIGLVYATNLPLALLSNGPQGVLSADLSVWRNLVVVLAGIPYFIVCLPLRDPAVKAWFRGGGS